MIAARHLVAPVAGAAMLAACVPQPAAPPVVPPPVAVQPAPTSAGYIATATALTRLAAAAKAAGVDATLAGTGPFTVFAPTDAAFARLAPGTVEALLRPDNRATLVRLLTYHVVPGTLTATDLAARVAAGNGTATLPTLAGESLTLTLTQGHLTLSDASGNRSYVETADVRRANGVVHVVNGVLVPTLE